MYQEILKMRKQILLQGSKYPLDRRPVASDFSGGPVNSQSDKSGGLVFFNWIKIYLSHCMIHVSSIKNILNCWLWVWFSWVPLSSKCIKDTLFHYWNLILFAVKLIMSLLLVLQIKIKINKRFIHAKLCSMQSLFLFSHFDSGLAKKILVQ